MRETDLIQSFVDRVLRLEALKSLVELKDLEDEINTAYESLRISSFTALVDPAVYIQELGKFLEIVMLGDADALAPELRLEIQEGVLNHKLHLAEASLLVSAYSVLLLAQTYASRPDAMRARATLSAMVDALAESIGDQLGFEELEAFLDLTGQVSQELTYIAANQVPIIQVELGARVPSTLLAWKLYQDPERAGEILDRNGIATPAYMPLKFKALSS